MKNLNLIVWLSQLGISVAVPPAAFIWLGDRFQLGSWIVILAVVVGISCAVEGLRTSLKAMDRMAKEKKEDTPPVSFNDHD